MGKKGKWTRVDPRVVMGTLSRQEKDVALLICAAAWEGLAWKKVRRWTLEQWSEFILKENVQAPMDYLVRIEVMERHADGTYNTVLPLGELTFELETIDPDFEKAMAELWQTVNGAVSYL